MNDLPGYSSASSPSFLTLVNLAPPSDSTTFQEGHLGHGPAFVVGAVQVKYAGSDPRERPAFSRLEVTFRGVERSNGGGEIELCEQTQILWRVGVAGGSSSSTGAEEAYPPIATPFKLELTPDLPSCLHLASSSLEYTLTASLFFADSSTPPIVRCSPVHLSRTSPPGSLLAGSNLALLSDSPATTPVIVPSAPSTPIPFSVRLPRTVFRRSEPVEVVTRVEIPDAKAIAEGLRLRTVSAELIRTIRVSGSGGGDGRPARRKLDDDDEVDEVYSSSRIFSTEASEQRTVLAHSGKSARFSPTRPIVIRLVLHPPAESSCESITQTTILHSVSFSVRITVGLVTLSPPSSSLSHPSSSALDATLTHEIFIVPDLVSKRSDKQKEVDRAEQAVSASSAAEGWLPLDGPVPTYVEDLHQDSGEAAPAASGSSSIALDVQQLEQLRRNFSSSASGGFDEWEEEYDGYEELSLPGVDDRPPPPPIDDDVSPPDAGDSAGSLSFEVAAAQGMTFARPDHEPDTEEDLDTYSPPPTDFSPLEEPGSFPPPSFLSHHQQQSASDDHEPTTPPPHVDFPPLSPLHDDLASTLPSIALPPPSPPPHSPTTASSGGEEGLPPPYFGSSTAASTFVDLSRALPPVPPPSSQAQQTSRASSLDRRERLRTMSSGAGTVGSGSAGTESGSSREGADACGGGEHERATAEGHEDDEGARPPPYESWPAE